MLSRVAVLLIAAACVQGPAQAADAPGSASFVGSSACTACHAKEYEAWQGSQHRAAMQEANDQTVLGNFNAARFTYAGNTSIFFKRGGKFFVRTDGADGKLAEFEV